MLALIQAVQQMGPSADSLSGFSLPAYLKHRNADVRYAAVQALVRTGYSQAAPDLLPLLKDPDLRVRRQAAGTLANFAYRDHAAVPVLIETMRNPKEDLYIRQVSAQALGKLGPWAKGAVPALSEVFKNEENDLTLRWWALRSVGQLAPGDKDVMAWLIELLGDKQDFLNRIHAARTLQEMGPEARSAVPALIGAFRAQDVKPPQLAENTRRQLVSTFATIGPDAKQAVPDLVGILNNTELDFGIRQGVAWALGEIGPAAKAAIPALRDAARPEENAAVRQEAAKSLRKIEP